MWGFKISFHYHILNTISGNFDLKKNMLYIRIHLACIYFLVGIFRS